MRPGACRLVVVVIGFASNLFDLLEGDTVEVFLTFDDPLREEGQTVVPFLVGVLEEFVHFFAVGIFDFLPVAVLADEVLFAFLVVGFSAFAVHVGGDIVGSSGKAAEVPLAVRALAVKSGRKPLFLVLVVVLPGNNDYDIAFRT